MMPFLWIRFFSSELCCKVRFGRQAQILLNTNEWGGFEFWLIIFCFLSTILPLSTLCWSLPWLTRSLLHSVSLSLSHIHSKTSSWELISKANSSRTQANVMYDDDDEQGIDQVHTSGCEEEVPAQWELSVVLWHGMSQVLLLYVPVEVLMRF